MCNFSSVDVLIVLTGVYFNAKYYIGHALSMLVILYIIHYTLCSIFV